MAAQDLISRYNYGAFVPAKFEPWLNFEASRPWGAGLPTSRSGTWTVRRRT